MSQRDRIDLHLHSNFSDGADSPEEVAKAADAAGLAAAALTDHDTLDGLPRFMACAEKYPELTLIPGVEISTRFNNRELHIVGLWVDPGCAELAEFLSQMRENRRKRAEIMAIKLAALGYPLPEEEWRGLSVVGRMHFARMLFKHYRFSDLNDVFAQLLRRGSPAFVPRPLPPPETAVAVLHRAGAAAVWAHPVFVQAGERGWMKRVLKHLVPAGLDAVEVYYSGFSPQQIELVSELAQHNGLAFSGGSDCHDISGSPPVGGTMPVPAALLAQLEARRPMK
ncbi:MAG: PHP domain-containing protein [Victivallaceae bacterium]|nr:PHP domain-containing protein [Victivallaceae bacterium]